MKKDYYNQNCKKCDFNLTSLELDWWDWLGKSIYCPNCGSKHLVEYREWYNSKSQTNDGCFYLMLI